MMTPAVQLETTHVVYHLLPLTIHPVAIKRDKCSLSGKLTYQVLSSDTERKLLHPREWMFCSFLAASEVVVGEGESSKLFCPGRRRGLKFILMEEAEATSQSDPLNVS